MSSTRRVHLECALVLTIALTWLHPAAAADKAISIPVQITHAQNFDPFPPPDGKKLVFISMLSGKVQLFTMDADGSNVVQLTRDDADHEDPASVTGRDQNRVRPHHQGPSQHRRYEN